MGSPMAGLMMIEVAVDARSGRMSCEASDKGEPKVKGERAERTGSERTGRDSAVSEGEAEGRIGVTGRSCVWYLLPHHERAMMTMKRLTDQRKT